MNKHSQIFQTDSPRRWQTFQWVSLTALLLVVAAIPFVWTAITHDPKPSLPELAGHYQKIKTQEQPRRFSARDSSRYRGFENFLKTHHLDRNGLRENLTTSRIRAAFYVDWDPQAFYSLQGHLEQLNMVVPEWFFLDPIADTLYTSIDPEALRLMKSQPGLRILPMLTNVNERNHSGDFDGQLLSAVLLNSAKRERLIADVERLLKQYDLAGINIDFEEHEERSIGALHRFQEELYTRMHKIGKLVSQDVSAGNEDYHMADLSRNNDYLFLMAYDQHYANSTPGPVADQRWIEKQLDEVAAGVPSGKIVLCLAGYGYDWPQGAIAKTVTYQQALSQAREYRSEVDYDNDSYNCRYSYEEAGGIHHDVYFNDAAATFNTIRFADEYGTAGVALWRLGAEDERMWSFYGRDLSNQAVQQAPFDFSRLSTIDMTNEKPDYEGEGEVLNLVNEPQKGVIDVQTDPAEYLVSEEQYRQLPTRYVIKRYGSVQVKDSLDHVVENRVVLTFDDGPDPDYTPRILRILEKEKVPAAFFVVGMNAEDNLPLLKNIYRDGFEIGNHSFTHPNMAEVSNRRAEAEMEATRFVIESATGRSTVLFRAPYNADAEPMRAVELKPVARGKQDGYYTVGESIDPEDWDLAHGVNADSIYNRVVRQYEANPSRGIILLHDAGGNREATVDALPRLIAYFKQHQVRFTTLANLMGVRKDQIMPPVRSQAVAVSGWTTTGIYWVEKFLYGAFWLAILLGLGRILSLAVLAILQAVRARRQLLVPPATSVGKVSIIIPAFNEEVNAVHTVANLLQQDYPDLEIIFVDDGSTDATYEKVRQAFAAEPRVRVLTKPNGGKASALNFGISVATSPVLVCIDADTQLYPDAVSQLMKSFTDEKVAAVAGNVKVGNEKNMLTRWQSIEYITAQNFDRRAFDYINGITVVPGAIGAFRKTAVEAAGGFTTDTLAEDCDLTIRIRRLGWVIRNCTQAVAVTEAPETLGQFMKQRFRWSYGVMQSFWKNRDACLNPRYGSLGLIALPNILLFQILMPILAPVADLLFFFSLGWSLHEGDTRTLEKIMLYYGLFLLVDLVVAILAFTFEKESYARLWRLIPQRFVYRQLMYVILFRSILRAIRGEGQGWGVLSRTGNARLAGTTFNSHAQPSKIGS